MLATLGTTVAASGIAGQVTAVQPSDREIYQQGLEIREETGETEAFEDYILNHGFDIAHQNSETYDFTHSTGDISTQRVKKADLDLYASVYTTQGEKYAYGDWSIDGGYEFTGSTGEDPKDIVGIAWEHSDYDLVWDSWNGGSHTSKREASVNTLISMTMVRLIPMGHLGIMLQLG